MSAECSAGNIPPGYKQTEVGVIPEDWNVETISAIAETSSGTTPSRAMEDRYFRNGHIAWVKTLDLNNSEVFFTEERVTQEALNETSLRCHPAGCIAVAMYGGYNQIGRTGILRIPATVNQALTVIKPNLHRLCSEYLLEVLNFRVDYWKSVASSSRKDPNITSKDIRDFSLALPSVKEQEAIAEALSDADAFIESLEQFIAKKRQIKQGAMQELLTGKRRLSGFSGEWEVKLLDDLFDFSGGLSASRDQLSMEGHCYLHYGDIHTSKKNFIDVRSEQQNIPKLDIYLKKVSSASLLDDGDVVFVDASEDDEGTSRHVVVFNEDKIPFISGLHTIVAKSKTNELDKQYRQYCFQTADVKKQFYFFAVGTKVSGISKTNIAKIMLPVPSLSEQIAIATILSDMDSEITALEEKLAKARQLKQGMMQELLTGRIRLL
ncbi:restriction endonuclease subunit S [Methanosarcina sp.]|uniref:restriction endonuclease subunit S n=1 Tax=Methanosarcina sp. TaxID=2213 RepID=UPI002ABAEF88|nr:restriction endonuclease subunit S [Methanosarcina sp.]MDY9925635.1 restriction endonuclease subunit S [Methanosarcina sp.]